ncbi:oligosaccharide flippase family protein [Nocardioides sp. QY071]|uniref:oligosaccharide flippase family protein n=1 Tax=Nocardioides sp. QY071 TaxID=3044187 RepID=UPI00249C3CE0|nr:oligosaccharide flippase family protein [Nocardioides sp. QY071]WGY01270.1 oligosaccharide flippase family protein [Nocardioides sp. QY071]
MSEPATDSGDAAAPAGTARGAGSRLSLITVDQALSSLSNIAALIWVAHAFDPVDFGRFSLIVMVYTVAQVAVRSLISTTVVVHPEEADQRPRTILASASVTGLVAGVLTGLAGAVLLAFGSALAWPVLALALPMPLLVVQDVGRYLGIARRQPGRAVAIDALWLVLMIAGFGTALAADLDGLVWPILMWSWSGGVSGLWVFAQYGLPGRDGVAWVREHWSFSWRSLVSGVASSGITLLFASLMTLFSSALAVAAYRAATLLAAPSTAVQLAVSTAAATDIARDRADEGAWWGHVRKAIAICLAVGVVNLVVLVFLPDPIGWAVLGESWDIVQPLMLAISCKVLLMAGQSGLRAALIGRHRIQTAMVTDIVALVLIGVCMVAGAVLGDAEGALWAMAVGTAVSTACWWIAIAWDGRAPRGRHVARRGDVVAARQG